MSEGERETYRWAAGLYGLVGVAFLVLAGAMGDALPPAEWIGNSMAVVVFGIAAYCAWVARTPGAR